MGEEAKIYKEAYHWVTLNSVCCIRLLEKNDAIMGEIKTMCDKRQLVVPEQEQLCTYRFMAEQLNDYSNLFNSLDAMFDFLRIIHLNEEELLMTKSAVRIIREILIRLGFSITPKAHIMFDHICDQQ